MAVNARLASSSPERRPQHLQLRLRLLPSLLLLLLLQTPAVLSIGSEDAGSRTQPSLSDPTTSTVLNSNSTDTLKSDSNSTKDIIDMPAVSLSLALGVSQELNPNPFIHPNPILSLSLSLSVSEELRGNPFEFMNEPLPTAPQDEADAYEEDSPQQLQEQRQPQLAGKPQQLQEQEQRQQQLAEKPQQLQEQEQRQQRLAGKPQQLQEQEQRQQRLARKPRRPINQGVSQQPANRSEEAVAPRKEPKGKCTYTVTIKTSCASPRATRDAISLAFGDAQHNEVYVARLDDPASGAFDRCSADTFRVDGPCGARTCYLYLRRSGRDGWTPEYVKVHYNLSGDPHAVVTFPYDAPLPSDFWYGFNLCHDGATAAYHSPSGDSKYRWQKDEDDDHDRGDPVIKMKTKVAGSVKTIIFV